MNIDGVFSDTIKKAMAARNIDPSKICLPGFGQEDDLLAKSKRGDADQKTTKKTISTDRKATEKTAT